MYLINCYSFTFSFVYSWETYCDVKQKKPITDRTTTISTTMTWCCGCKVQQEGGASDGDDDDDDSEGGQVYKVYNNQA